MNTPRCSLRYSPWAICWAQFNESSWTHQIRDLRISIMRHRFDSKQQHHVQFTVDLIKLFSSMYILIIFVGRGITPVSVLWCFVKWELDCYDTKSPWPFWKRSLNKMIVALWHMFLIGHPCQYILIYPHWMWTLFFYD